MSPHDTRMHPAAWIGLAFGIVVAVALLMPATARASGKAVADGNDVSGKLDIRSVTKEHATSGPVVHTITTYGRWKSRAIAARRSNFFVFEFNTGGDRRPERIALVYRDHGILRVAVLSRAGRFIGWGTASRPSASSIRVAVPRKLLGKPFGYRWKVFSVYFASGACRSGCVDRAPNHGTSLHDITAPTVTFPPLAMPASTTTSIPFTVTDRGGSHTRRWSVEQRLAGDTTWSVIATGATGGDHRVSVNASEGQTFEYRIVAQDGGENVTTSQVRSITFPIDDGNAQMSYAGTWATSNADGLDYLATLHTTTDTTTPATMTVTFQGSTVAILARGSCGTGSVAIDGGSATPTTQLCGDEHRAIVYRADSLTPGTHTLTLTVDGGTFRFDGLVVR
jgi:hypothetical protein